MLYFEITEIDSVKNIKVQICESSFVMMKSFLKNLLNARQYALIKMKTSGPSHQTDELKAPGSLLLKKFIAG